MCRGQKSLPRATRPKKRGGTSAKKRPGPDSNNSSKKLLSSLKRSRSHFLLQSASPRKINLSSRQQLQRRQPTSSLETCATLACSSANESPVSKFRRRPTFCEVIVRAEDELSGTNVPELSGGSGWGRRSQ